MHEPAGVVEILVQNPQNTPYSEVQFQNTPPMKIVRESKSKSFRIPPTKMKIVRESKSESFRIPPKMKIVRESKSKSFRIPPTKMKIVRESKSESFRIPPKMKIVRESKFESFRIPPPPKIRKTSDFKLQNSLKIREIYVETNL